MFAHGAEKTFKVRVEVDAAQVANEKIETGASGQAVARTWTSSMEHVLLRQLRDIQPSTIWVTRIGTLGWKKI
jgi:hypothetical protein